MTRIFSLDSEVVINQPPDKVFEFFSKAENLELITPDWLRFRILTPVPIDMHAGKQIDYELKLYGLPFKWKTAITIWDPPHRFVDTQLQGPYISWVHEHRFSAKGNRTQMIDHVDYAVPGRILSPMIQALFVRKKVESIFSYRAQVIRKYLI